MSSEILSFPQRKILKNYRSVTGHFPSIKNNRSVAFESLLEKTYFLTLEFDSSVKSYSEQPQITIEYNGNPKTYSADCYVIYHQSSGKKNMIVEAKYENELAKDRDNLMEKFERARVSLQKMDMDFFLFTDATYPEIYIRNLDFLYRYKTFIHSDENDSRILNAINVPISTSELANSLAKSKTDYFQLANSIWALVANGHLDTNLDDQEITMNSIVWRDNERY
jgi:hypothetical protein